MNLLSKGPSGKLQCVDQSGRKRGKAEAHSSTFYQGRIDKKLLLGYMDPDEVILMLGHYFQEELTQAQRTRLELAIEGPPRLNLTPAQIEQLTAEHDTIDDMIAALEEKSRPPLPPATKVGGTAPNLSGGVSTRSVSINYDGV